MKFRIKKDLKHADIWDLYVEAGADKWDYVSFHFGRERAEAAAARFKFACAAPVEEYIYEC